VTSCLNLKAVDYAPFNSRSSQATLSNHMVLGYLVNGLYAVTTSKSYS